MKMETDLQGKLCFALEHCPFPYSNLGDIADSLMELYPGEVVKEHDRLRIISNLLLLIDDGLVAERAEYAEVYRLTAKGHKALAITRKLMTEANVDDGN